MRRKLKSNQDGCWFSAKDAFEAKIIETDVIPLGDGILPHNQVS
jgi:hypothetical protein